MKKLYIETYGCQMNVADSEVVASVMQMAGYEATEELSEAPKSLVRPTQSSSIHAVSETMPNRKSIIVLRR